MTDRLVALLVWTICFLGFSLGGVIGAFYPDVVQRAILSAPPPKLKFLPRPDQKLFGIGGREYFEGHRYIITLRVVGFASLAVAVLMLAHLLQALLRSR